MKKKVLLALMLVFVMCVFAACGKDEDKKEDTTTEATTAQTEKPTEEITEATSEDASEVTTGTTGEATSEDTQEADEEENYETGDASLDNPRNDDNPAEKEILVVSFGTSFNDSRRLDIGGIEAAIEKEFPDWTVRRAFTAQIIIDHVQRRDGEKIDNVQEALDRAVASGVKVLAIQPTHLMHGYEYDELVEEVAKYADSFEKIIISEPLLTSDEDFENVANIVAKETSAFDDGETAVCFMGHGTEHEANAVYTKMQETFEKLGYKNYFVGTVEAEPSFQDVIDKVTELGGYKKAVLRPLMVVAGDHANNDMAGDEDDTWKTLFKNAGYEVETDIQGLGRVADIQAIYVAHLKTAIEANEE